MKKFIITIIVLLLLVGGGATYYFLNMKTYDISEDEELVKIAEEEYVVELPIEEPADVTEGEKPADPSLVEEAPADEKTEAGNKAQETTADSILAKYRPSFENLEAQANGKINSLISHAYNEYVEKKNNGEKISINYFLSKYKTAGEQLEAKTDQAFQHLYSALQKDLKDNGFDASEANGVKEAYEQAKKERRNALLKKAMEQI